MQKPVRIFLSYAEEDEIFVDDLRNQLSQLRKKKLIADFHDRQILPGTEWDHTIRSEIDTADIIIFLVSADFLASDYIDRVEIRNALERHRQGMVKIVPVLVRICDFKNSELSGFQALPKRSLPVNQWKDKDEAWYSVVQSLEQLIKESFSIGQTVLPDHPDEPSPDNNHTSSIPAWRKKGCRIQMAVTFMVLLVGTAIFTYINFNQPGSDIVSSLNDSTVSADTIRTDPPRTIPVDSVVAMQQVNVRIVSIQKMANCSAGADYFYYTFKVNDSIITSIDSLHDRSIRMNDNLRLLPAKKISVFNKTGEYFDIQFEVWQNNRDKKDHFFQTRRIHYQNGHWETGQNTIQLTGERYRCKLLVTYKIDLPD
ncbi:MAG: toll/interleukin-1 receptor domain-containing protein [Chitinophagaceae bacterium]|nr:toll/interleukin-1 receptor domain-containing protein [Chitinophagaceae bacterium]